jgi:hypothetical protein
MNHKIVVVLLAVAILMTTPVAPQTPTPTVTTSAPTPTPTAFDNTRINVTYIDLLTTYVVAELFQAPDQRFWPFLLTLTESLVAANVSVTPASSLYQYMNRPSTTTATVAVRAFSTGQIAIPYEAFDAYIITLVHNGTEQHADDTIRAINGGALVDSLGVSAAFYIPDFAKIYAGGIVVTGAGDGQLSVGWHVLLVVGVTLVYGLIIAARFRQQQHQASSAPTDKALNLGGAEPIEAHAALWEEDDLEGRADALLEQSLINNRATAARGARMAERDATVDTSYVDVTSPHYKQLLACQYALADVRVSDKLAARAGTISGPTARGIVTPAGGDGVANLNASNTAGDDAGGEWSLQQVQDILDIDPSYNLPPQTAQGQQSAAEMRLAARAARRRMRERANMAAGDADDELPPTGDSPRRRPTRDDDDDDDFDLPPDGDEYAQLRAHEAEAQKLVQQRAPLGLAARRLARMMTSMAQDESQMNPAFSANSVHRSYQLSFNIDGQQSRLAARRSLRHAEFVERVEAAAHAKAGGYASGDTASDSASQSPKHSPSPLRPSENTAAVQSDAQPAAATVPASAAQRANPQVSTPASEPQPAVQPHVFTAAELDDL